MGAVGQLLVEDPERGRAELLAVVERNHGNICRMAWELGIHRRNVYRQLYKAQLWPEVHAARARERRAQEPEWLHDTREALRV